uniref:Protein-S-isoprenylcysteine O-methyltransferase n=1 Tax=Mycena chlorophos TaxID=658473 RepID=A0ABQ0MCX9_MYCCL|nr:predicted protein [Mycena chlorophos]
MERDNGSRGAVGLDVKHGDGLLAVSSLFLWDERPRIMMFSVAGTGIVRNASANRNAGAGRLKFFQSHKRSENLTRGASTVRPDGSGIQCIFYYLRDARAIKLAKPKSASWKADKRRLLLLGRGSYRYRSSPPPQKTPAFRVGPRPTHPSTHWQLATSAMNSLLVLPRIIASLSCALGFHISLTPPNPPLKSCETIRASRLDAVLLAMGVREGMKMLLWAATGVEITLLLLPITFGSFGLGLGHSSTKLSLPTLPHTLTARMLTGALLLSAGGLLRLQCYRTLGRHFTFEPGIAADHTLITHGPYGIVRHPSYAASVLVFAGLVGYYGARGTWVAEALLLGAASGRGLNLSLVGVCLVVGFIGVVGLMVVGLICRMPGEDQALRARFGAEWDRWAERVPFMICPGVL